MKFQNLKKEFSAKKIGKADFIKAASEIHQNLFAYPKILETSEVNEILIDETGLAFQIGTNGLWLRCPPGESRVAPLEIMNFGAYEPQETKLMISLISEAKTILDIGANIGWFSILFADRTQQAEVHAFEPLPLFYNYLVENIKLNNLRDSVFAYQFGFSDECKSVEYFVDAGNGTNASLRNVADSNSVEVVQGKVVTLDQWVSEMKIEPDFIKCDVEGAEHLVMKGAQSVLSTIRPIVFLEMLRKWTEPYGYSPNDIITLFAAHNYICCGVGEVTNRIVHDVNNQTIETNYVFLHKEKHLGQLIKLGLEV